MAKIKKTFILSYNVRLELRATSIRQAVKLTKEYLEGLSHISDASVVDESTGEEIFV